MTLLQLSLRTMLWILFAAALLIGWGWERWGLLGEWKKLDERKGSNQPKPALSAWSLERHAKAAELAKRSDEELRRDFVDPAVSGSWFSAREPWLTEMARRGMSADLRLDLDRIADGPGHSRTFASTITALRRAEQKPDPVEIDVEWVEVDAEGNRSPVLLVCGIVRNADIDREPICISWGGDYRSGRRDRWRVELRDEQGKRVPDSNFISWEGGGRGGESVLEFGQSLRYRPTMDPRCYVSPPPSGRYQLQLVHAELDIAGEEDLTSLIVWKSQPMWVDVVNREADQFDLTLIRAGLVMALAIGVLLVSRCFASQRTGEETGIAPWWDLAACVLIVALAAGWWIDAHQLRTGIAQLTPHTESDWTIVPPRGMLSEQQAN